MNVNRQIVRYSVVGLVVLVLVGVLFIVLRNVGVIGDSGPMTSYERSEELMEGALSQCDNEKYVDACKRGLVNGAASEHEDAKFCEELEGVDRDRCVVLVAYETLDVKVCKGSDGEARVACEDLVYKGLAASDLDLGLCGEIENEVMRAECLESVTAKVVSDGSCEDHGVEIGLCNRVGIFDKAIAGRDVEVCRELVDEMDVNRCVDFVLKNVAYDGLVAKSGGGVGSVILDSDGDGLSDKEEADVYGTDPLVADTDGDGFNDGIEIGNGYDPLK